MSPGDDYFWLYFTIMVTPIFLGFVWAVASLYLDCKAERGRQQQIKQESQRISALLRAGKIPLPGQRKKSGLSQYENPPE